MRPQKGQPVGHSAVGEARAENARRRKGHGYRLFGIGVHSEVHLPGQELDRGIKASDPSILRIRYGRVPPPFSQSTAAGAQFDASLGRFRLKAPGVAAYAVFDGRDIVVDPVDGSNEADVRLLLLGPIMGALLHQQGKIVFHASSVVGPKGAVLFCGDSGAGKSTLAAALHRHGWTLVADEICAVDLRGGDVTVVSGLPHIDLWRNSLSALGNPRADMARIRPGLDKFRVAVPHQLRERAYRLVRIYELVPGELDRTDIRPLDGLERLAALRDNTYRAQFMLNRCVGQRHFQQILSLGSRVSVARVTRPLRGILCSETVDAILRDLG